MGCVHDKHIMWADISLGGYVHNKHHIMWDDIFLQISQHTEMLSAQYFCAKVKHTENVMQRNLGINRNISSLLVINIL